MRDRILILCIGRLLRLFRGSGRGGSGRVVLRLRFGERWVRSRGVIVRILRDLRRWLRGMRLWRSGIRMIVREGKN